jgi:hypothetical protein
MVAHYQIRSMDSWAHAYSGARSDIPGLAPSTERRVSHALLYEILFFSDLGTIFEVPLSKYLAFHYASAWSRFVCPPPSCTLTPTSVRLTVEVRKGTVINFIIFHSIFCNDNTAFFIITHLNESKKTTCNWFYSVYINVYIIVEEHTNKDITFVHTHLSLKHSKPTSRAAVHKGYTCV